MLATRIDLHKDGVYKFARGNARATFMFTVHCRMEEKQLTAVQHPLQMEAGHP